MKMKWIKINWGTGPLKKRVKRELEPDLEKQHVKIQNRFRKKKQIILY